MLCRCRYSGESPRGLANWHGSSRSNRGFFGVLAAVGRQRRGSGEAAAKTSTSSRLRLPDRCCTPTASLWALFWTAGEGSPGMWALAGALDAANAFQLVTAFPNDNLSSECAAPVDTEGEVAGHGGGASLSAFSQLATICGHFATMIDFHAPFATSPPALLCRATLANFPSQAINPSAFEIPFRKLTKDAGLIAGRRRSQITVPGTLRPLLPPRARRPHHCRF